MKAEELSVLDEAYRCVQIVRLCVSADAASRTDDQLRATQNGLLDLARNYSEPSSVPAMEDGERAALESLGAAWNAFAALTPSHPSDRSEFQSAIHRAQDIIACRLARRCYPDVFCTHEPTPL